MIYTHVLNRGGRGVQSPEGDVRKRKMRGNTLQCMPEIATASYWNSTACAATDPLQARGDYEAVQARFVEVIGMSNCS
jgi:hypothetical protein